MKVYTKRLILDKYSFYKGCNQVKLVNCLPVNPYKINIVCNSPLIFTVDISINKLLVEGCKVLCWIEMM